jgi:hypothetical protein
MRDDRRGRAAGLVRPTGAREPDRRAMIPSPATFGSSAGLENNIATLRGSSRPIASRSFDKHRRDAKRCNGLPHLEG